jgi:hypothetical protein
MNLSRGRIRAENSDETSLATSRRKIDDFGRAQ